jgi:hypothetical protein
MRSSYPLFRLGLILVIVGAIVFFIPFKVPFTVAAHGRIHHGQEWVLARESAGMIGASLYDRVTGRTDSYRLHQFERQDAVHFALHPAVIPGAMVHEGDTVAQISSLQLERELTNLEGDLALARATLQTYRAGEKEADVDEARNRLVYARQQRDGHDTIIQRTRLLHERDLISDEELEIVLNQGKLYDIEIAIAEAHLRSISSGVKAEELEYLSTRIVAMEKNIEALRRAIDEYVYTSPIDGIVYQVHTRDTLAIIGDRSRYVSVIPVPLRYKNFLKIGDTVRIRVPNNNADSYQATIHSIGNTVTVMNGGQYFAVTALISDNEVSYLPGKLVHARIRMEPVTVREYLLRYVRPILH